MEPILSPHITRDGRTLALYDWMLQPGLAVRGVVLLVHGLGEHMGRYQALAELLNTWGFAVRGYDQHGHGESHGVRGSLPNDTCLLDDLAEVIDETRTRMAPDVPLILLGHSLGGLVAARLVALKMRTVQALVLSSPALDAGLSAFQKMQVALIPRLLPNLRVGNGLDPKDLSHDAKVVEAYKADRLVHDRISARLGAFIAEAGPATVALAPGWSVPTLLLYAGQDRCVNPEGSRRFSQLAPAELVHTVRFGDLYHELFNELHAAPVFVALQQWLGERY
jgi:alpha-beta hydrolase superfamily lysophospholipase